MFKVCMEGSKEDAMKLIEKVGVKLVGDEKDLLVKQLLKASCFFFFQKFCCFPFD